MCSHQTLCTVIEKHFLIPRAERDPLQMTDLMFPYLLEQMMQKTEDICPATIAVAGVSCGGQPARDPIKPCRKHQEG